MELARQHRPDIVIVDEGVPTMGGIRTLEAIRESRPCLPAVVFAGSSEAVGPVLSATRWLLKPGDTGEQGRASFQEELLDTIQELLEDPGPAPRPASRAPLRTGSPGDGEPFRLLAIGSSTGGPEALTRVLGGLPGDFPAPIVIVQHMPAQFTRPFAMRLDSKCAIRVKEGEAGDELQSGVAYIAPGGKHMVLHEELGRVVIRTNQDPPEHSSRPAVDPLFRSAVDIFGGAILGVVLTGMGCDGAGGCQAIHGAGGRILIQDKDTSVVWGMPGAVDKADIPNRALPLGRIAGALTMAFCSGSRRTRKA